ncbi:MAG: nucleoside triphosphate pyrophosphohydrolase [Ruminococcus sp.]|uniref:nucleoside triphosphate pyrophosphohydrolase n=1 Tax=Ruminococcus sp. TaxID=41978 RepID=UPI0025FCBB01|nr:nucleoside triphosphate pyrophosphohydrolase [Ruminococcus sp.]MBR5683987.1 nucleoside triphosphate pyrophosphohydrolase [Ruminococcus sp.]
MRAVHNKLVRDKIPEIIANAGKTAHTHILTEDEYIAELDKKLGEEVAEYQVDKSIEELADMLEVMYAIAQARGWSVSELEKVRSEKAEKRGGFKDKIYLEYVEDGNE